MRTPAQIAGHPVHPMLVTIPIGLWVFSLACDLISLRVDDPGVWQTTAFHAMVGGIIGALAAAVPGLVDLLSLRDPPIRKTALIHMSLNLALVALYIFNAWTRYDQSMPREISIALSAVGVVVLGISGWLGGKMVYVAGVAVHAGDLASADSPAVRRSPEAARPARGGAGRAWGERATASDAGGQGDRPAARENTGRGDRTRSDRPR